jgi:hypothetical protein
VINVLALCLMFLFSLSIGLFQLVRTRDAQAWFMRYRSEHPILGSMSFLSKQFMSSPYYLAWIRVVGVGFIIFAGVALYAVIHLLRR